MSTILSGTAVGIGTTDTRLMMKRDDVRTIFSVYRIWQQETLAPSVTDREAAEAWQVVETQIAQSRHQDAAPRLRALVIQNHQV